LADFLGFVPFEVCISVSLFFGLFAVFVAGLAPNILGGTFVGDGPLVVIFAEETYRVVYAFV